MELKLLLVTILVLSEFSSHHKVHGQQVFDITKYGAKPGADISEALVSAWKEASASATPTKVLVPPGTWDLSQVKLEHNKAPIELQVHGTIIANPDANQLPDKQAEWITINYVDFFTLSGGGVFDGRGEQAWKKNDCGSNTNCAKMPINLSFNFITNSIIQDVTTKDSKNFHVNCISSSNVTFQRFTVSAPGESVNTDGIHIARDNGVYVRDSVIKTGDDCVSIGDESTEIHIQNVTCGPGHGVSIGSLGKNPNEKDVSGVYVQNCTFINTQNGVRVKTWPSAPAQIKVSNLHFEDLIMENVSNPIIIDQEYCPYNQCKLDKPSLIQISNVNIKNIRGTSFTPEALTFWCSSTKPCVGLQVGDVNLGFSGKEGKITTKCKNVKPSIIGKQSMPVCGPGSDI